jgi:hypothetical protein
LSCERLELLEGGHSLAGLRHQSVAVFPLLRIFHMGLEGRLEAAVYTSHLPGGLYLALK